MTVVAALRIEGIPSLIGDFLVTDDQLDRDHFWLPTRSAYPNNSRYSINIPRRISGIVRKLHLINERFIVGFAGPIKAGAVIFAELERRFGNYNNGPPISKISKALQLFNVQFRDQGVIVIGWTCGSRPRCFRWEAGLNSSAIHVTHAIAGSGRDHFTSVLINEHGPGPWRTAFDKSTGVLSQHPGVGYYPHVETAFQKAALLGLVKLGAVLSEERVGARNLQASYGYGAEIALYTGNRFEFVSKVGYFLWFARIEKNESIEITPAKSKVIYEARGRHCVFYWEHFDIGGNGIMNVTRSDCAVLTPPLDISMQNANESSCDLYGNKWTTPTTECTYYFHCILTIDTRINESSRSNESHPIFVVERAGTGGLFREDCSNYI
jgi:hypothetical protein